MFLQVYSVELEIVKYLCVEECNYTLGLSIRRGADDEQLLKDFRPFLSSSSAAAALQTTGENLPTALEIPLRQAATHRSARISQSSSGITKREQNLRKS